MLKTIAFRQFDKTLPCVILLGGFDGLHLGHRRLVERAKEFGLPIGIMTIDGCKSTGDLFTVAERERIFAEAGVDFALEMPFESIRNLSPAQFIDLLKSGREVKAFVCGTDFRFGFGAKGDFNTIAELGEQVCVEELLFEGEEKIGASLVKEKLKLGDVEGANKLLGTCFFVEGEVVADRKVGRKIGFPTANIRYPKGKFEIKQGVYESYAIIDGKEYKGITNYGARPTFSNEQILTETHFISYMGDLYGKTLRIYLKKWLRGNQKFESAEALKNQLTEDVRRVTEND